jgi:hypothetical protein
MHGAFGGVVRQADAAVVDETCEHIPAFEHVVHSLATSLRRESLVCCSRIQVSRSATNGALSSWRAALAPFRRLAVDASFNLEQGVDPADSLQRQGRDHCRLLPCALRREFSAGSAITKNDRRAWTQHAASRIGPVSRLGSQSLP